MNSQKNEDKKINKQKIFTHKILISTNKFRKKKKDKEKIENKKKFIHTKIAKNNKNNFENKEVLLQYSTPEHVTLECRKLIGRMLVRDPARRATLAEIVNNAWVYICT
jgi:serine/threonine protein kinase